MTTSDLPLVHEHRPGTVASDAPDAPAVVSIHGRGTDERDLLPLDERLPDELEVQVDTADSELSPRGRPNSTSIRTVS